MSEPTPEARAVSGSRGRGQGAEAIGVQPDHIASRVPA